MLTAGPHQPLLRKFVAGDNPGSASGLNCPGQREGMRAGEEIWFRNKLSSMVRTGQIEGDHLPVYPAIF